MVVGSRICKTDGFELLVYNHDFNFEILAYMILLDGQAM